MNLRRAASTLMSGALSFTLVFAPLPALGQPANAAAKAAAQALFDEARQLTADNNYEAACPKLAESHQLDPTTGTKFYLADCLEHIGKFASAWTFYIDAADSAAAAGQKPRATFARERAEAMKQRYSTITITVPDSLRGLAGFSLSRNGTPLGKALWGTAVPVDPGEYVISAAAKGYQPWETRVQIQAEPQQIAVEVPALTAQQARAEPAVKAPDAKPAPEPSPRPPEGRWKPQRIAGIAVGSAGVVAVGIGAAFGGLAVSKQKASNADGHCDASNFCDDTGLSLRSDAITSATISTVGLIAGGALLAGGVVLYFTAPAAGPSKTAAKGGTGPVITAGPGGLSITGTW